MDKAPSSFVLLIVAVASVRTLCLFLCSTDADICYYALDKKRSGVYNKKTPYVQWKSDAFAWANKKNTAVGDKNIGYDEQYAYFYEAVDANNEGKATDYVVEGNEVDWVAIKDEDVANSKMFSYRNWDWKIK